MELKSRWHDWLRPLLHDDLQTNPLPSLGIIGHRAIVMIHGGWPCWIARPEKCVLSQARCLSSCVEVCEAYPFAKPPSQVQLRPFGLLRMNPRAPCERNILFSAVPAAFLLHALVYEQALLPYTSVKYSPVSGRRPMFWAFSNHGTTPGGLEPLITTAARLQLRPSSADSARQTPPCQPLASLVFPPTQNISIGADPGGKCRALSPH
eukprot:SAG31_NODE_6606_length_1954_cov_2.087871_2_plen_207_part_00